MRRPNWIAEYTDGTWLPERLPSGGTSNFYDIERDRLRRFVLVFTPSMECSFDAATGQFYFNNQEFRHSIVDAVRNQGINYGLDLIQFKRAHVDMISDENGEMLPEVIDTANIGYKVTIGDFLYTIIFVYDYDDNQVYLDLKVTNLLDEVVTHSELTNITSEVTPDASNE